MVENVSAVDNSLIDCFEGRKVNPGHDLEAMWFLMNLGIRRKDKALIDKAVEISLRVIDYGWDKEYGGIFYFMDRKGYPTQELEWDQKLWWVHIESAIAMLKGYRLTGNEKCLEWFLRLDDVPLDLFQGQGVSRVVRLPEPPWGSPATAQGRKVERMLPCSERSLSDRLHAGGHL